MNTFDAATCLTRNTHSPPKAKTTILALEYFPVGEGRHEEKNIETEYKQISSEKGDTANHIKFELLVLEYFPTTILEETSTGGSAVIRPEIQGRGRSSQPRKVIVKWKGKGKVSSMTVIDMKEYFKKLSKKENGGEIQNITSSPKRKFKVPNIDDTLSPAKKTKFTHTRQFWKILKGSNSGGKQFPGINSEARSNPK